MPKQAEIKKDKLRTLCIYTDQLKTAFFLFHVNTVFLYTTDSTFYNAALHSTQLRVLKRHITRAEEIPSKVACTIRIMTMTMRMTH